MPYAFDLILRTLDARVQEHYRSLGPDGRLEFKARLRDALERADHAVPTPLWARFLREEWPRLYADAGAPAFPLCCLPFSPEWYQAMRHRVLRRQHTWREGDVDACALDDFGFDGDREDNGSTRITGFSALAPHRRGGEALRRRATGYRGNQRRKRRKAA